MTDLRGGGGIYKRKRRKSCEQVQSCPHFVVESGKNKI
jgi:hypothetical protein